MKASCCEDQPPPQESGGSKPDEDINPSGFISKPGGRMAAGTAS